MDYPLINGFLIGLSLIVAIGAQNAMVIKIGIIGKNIFIIALFCALSDAILIAIGVAGGGYIFQSIPIFIEIMRWGGVLYIAFFLKNLIKELINPKSLEYQDSNNSNLINNIKIIAGVTWLNPHVYLDTIGLIASVSAPYIGQTRLFFAMGAMLASFTWFFGIIYGARMLAPILSKPQNWRIINIIIFCVMVYILYNLIFGFKN